MVFELRVLYLDRVDVLDLEYLPVRMCLGLCTVNGLEVPDL